jgi:hypothetical protein
MCRSKHCSERKIRRSFQFTTLRECLGSTREAPGEETVDMTTECQPADTAILIFHGDSDAE